MCVNMADPTQLSGVGGDDNEMDSFRLLNLDLKMVIPLLFFQTVEQGTSTKTTQNGICFIFTYHPKKMTGKVGSADSLRKNYH